MFLVPSSMIFPHHVVILRSHLLLPLQKPVHHRRLHLPNQCPKALSKPSLTDSVPRGAEGAGSAAPKHQNMDDKLLVELGEGVPFRDDALKAEAITHEHLRTHFPKNPFCRICNISKNTSARVARKPDGRSDDGIDVPTQPMQQLATDDVILAMGPDHPGIGVGGVKAHHVIRCQDRVSDHQKRHCGTRQEPASLLRSKIIRQSSTCACEAR